MELNKHMNIKKCLSLMGLILFAVFLLPGCGKQDGKVDAQAFDKAAPEIKADWDAAVAADKDNEYFTASASYAKVMKQESKLTPKQFESVLAASQALSQRLTAAADGGDAAAKQALAKLMRMQNQR